MDSESPKDASKEPTEAESFVERWLRETRGNSDLDDGLLDLINEHRSGSELNESALLQALIEHADKETSKDNGPTS